MGSIVSSPPPSSEQQQHHQGGGGKESPINKKAFHFNLPVPSRCQCAAFPASATAAGACKVNELYLTTGFRSLVQSSFELLSTRIPVIGPNENVTEVILNFCKQEWDKEGKDVNNKAKAKAKARSSGRKGFFPSALQNSSTSITSSNPRTASSSSLATAASIRSPTFLSGNSLACWKLTPFLLDLSHRYHPNNVNQLNSLYHAFSSVQHYPERFPPFVTSSSSSVSFRHAHVDRDNILIFTYSVEHSLVEVMYVGIAENEDILSSSSSTAAAADAEAVVGEPRSLGDEVYVCFAWVSTQSPAAEDGGGSSNSRVEDSRREQLLVGASSSKSKTVAVDKRQQQDVSDSGNGGGSGLFLPVLCCY